MQKAARVSHGAMPRLRFDKVALRMVQGVRNALEGAVPDGLCVVFAVTAPVREPAKTMAALAETIRARLSLGTVAGEQAEALHGNEVRLRFVTSRSPHAVRVAGFVHNPDPPPDAMLDMAQSLLQSMKPPNAGERSATSDLETLRHVCKQVLDPAGSAKAIAAIDSQVARATRD